VGGFGGKRGMYPFEPFQKELATDSSITISVGLWPTSIVEWLPQNIWLMVWNIFYFSIYWE
jgi:hypothetical protein